MSERHDCWVPVPHRHRPPTAAEVAESRFTIQIEHPKSCAWRQDVYEGCSCGLTGLVMQIQDTMAERRESGRK